MLFEPRYSTLRYDSKNKIILDEAFFTTVKPGIIVDVMEVALQTFVGELSLTKHDLKKEAKNRCCVNGKKCEFWKPNEAFWEKNLEVLLYSLENEANLKPIGRFMIRENLLSNLCAQIMLNNLLETKRRLVSCSMYQLAT